MIDNYGILYYFVYQCGVCERVGGVKHHIKFWIFTNLLKLEIFYWSRSFFPEAERSGVCTALLTVQIHPHILDVIVNKRVFSIISSKMRMSNSVPFLRPWGECFFGSRPLSLWFGSFTTNDCGVHLLVSFLKLHLLNSSPFSDLSLK